MDDKDALIALLDRFEVPWTVKDGAYENGGRDRPGSTVTVEAHSSPKVIGYGGFATEWYFNPDGSFDRVGVWE